MKLTFSALEHSPFLSNIKSFFKKRYGVIVFVILIASFLYWGYLLFGITYDTLLFQQNIDASALQSKQEKINLQRYQQVTDKMENHQKPAAPTTAISIIR